MQIPVIETERLRLRAHRPEDFEVAARIWGDEKVVRFIGGKPSTRQASWRRLLNYAGHWQFMGFGYWAVEEKSSGQYVGDIGFADFKRDFEGAEKFDLKGVPEMGWVLSPSVHGKGYATEAVSAALAWADANFSKLSVFKNFPRNADGKIRTFCLIDPANAGSFRVAEKAGFKQIGHLVYMGGQVALFER